MYIKKKKDHGGLRHLNLSLQCWQQALRLSFPSLETLSSFLTQRKTSLSCYSVLPRFPLDRKWKTEKTNPLKLSLSFSLLHLEFSSLLSFVISKCQPLMKIANPFFIFILLFYSPRWRVTHSDTGMAPWQKHASGELSTSSAMGLRGFVGILGASGWFDVAWHNPAKIGGRKHRALFTPFGQKVYWS